MQETLYIIKLKLFYSHVFYLFVGDGAKKLLNLVSTENDSARPGSRGNVTVLNRRRFYCLYLRQ